MNNWKTYSLLAAVLLLPAAFISGIAYSGASPIDMAIQPLVDLNIMPTLAVMLVTTFLVERLLEVLVSILRNASQDEAYKKQTRVFAIWVSYAVGLVVAVSGVRMLTPLLDVQDVSAAHSVAFSYVDTMLTAGLLSAGTQGVHQLNKALSTFLGRAEKQIQNGA